MNANEPLIIREGNTSEDAAIKAYRIAMETHREAVPVQIFKQGKREIICGALPVRVIKRLLKYNATTKGTTAESAISTTNRPVDKNHVKAITTYLTNALETGENYILPPLTLNATGGMTIVVPQGDSEIKSGFAILPDETGVLITDGQHRFLAIEQVANDKVGTTEGNEFMNASVPIMMTIGSQPNQMHQDFADAGKTKALPPSLLAVYDTKQPANHAVMEICENLPLMKGRVDATSNSLRKGSELIFLVNQVRQFVKHSLTGTSANEQRFAEEAKAAMTNPESRERWIKSRIAFLKVITELIPDWNEIAQLSPPGGADSARTLERTKEIKQRENVPLNGAFLTALGLVSYEVLKEVTGASKDEPELIDEIRKRLEPLKEIDWARSAQIWDGNIVTGGKIRTQGSAVKAASEKMLKLLDATTQADN